MPTLAAIREQRRSERLSSLRQGVRAVAAASPQTQVWLFGSLARGDWDAYSDVDLLAIAPAKPEAEALADALLAAQLGDDVLAMTLDRWEQLLSSEEPYWREIRQEAIRLDAP
jgi:predicted nucleotidyltransferase